MWYKVRPRCVQIIRVLRRAVNRYSPPGEERLMRIAVVGSGVSGLGAAYLLARAHDVHVFERDGRAGGHANTVVHDGLALDTGFLVHNERNYPLLGRLFRELGVATHESDMSFSVSCSGCGLEYSGRRPFAQPANLAQARVRRAAVGDRPLAADGAAAGTRRSRWPSTSTSTAISRRFRRHFLVPLTSALWSTAPGRALEFPAAYAIRFFDNHGMLGFGRFRWRTVTGGSRRYVDAIAAAARRAARLGSGVRSVRRSPDGVELRIGDRVERFDHVVLATHADQALALLEDPTPDERRVLGGFALHDERGDPAHRLLATCRERRAARASWNYRLGDDGRSDDHLPPQPAAGAHRRARLLRDPERAGAGGARPRAVHLRAPALHGRDAARAGASCRGSAAGARTTRAPTSATASTRTASRAASRPPAALGVEW